MPALKSHNDQSHSRVKEARKAAASGEGPPVLYLNAGDTYTGTAWFTIYKWKIAAEFINALQPDAVVRIFLLYIFFFVSAT